MTEAADHQPGGPAYCLAEETRDGIGYICSQETHTGRHKMIKAENMPLRLVEALANQTVADLEDRTDLIPADQPTAVMQTMSELADLVGLAEIDRRFDLLSYEVKTGIAIAAELRIAKLCWADDRPADVASVQRIKKHVDAWLLQVGIREDGGS